MAAVGLSVIFGVTQVVFVAWFHFLRQNHFFSGEKMGAEPEAGWFLWPVSRFQTGLVDFAGSLLGLTLSGRSSIVVIGDGQ